MQIKYKRQKIKIFIRLRKCEVQVKKNEKNIRRIELGRNMDKNEKNKGISNHKT